LFDKLDVFFVFSHNSHDCVDHLRVLLIKFNHRNGIEKFLEIILDLSWVGSNRQNLKKDLI